MAKIKLSLSTIYRLLKLKRTRVLSVLVILFLILGLGYFQVARAGAIGDLFSYILAYIFLGLSFLFGKIAMMIFSLVVDISTYNAFLDNPAVTNGWVIIRDICNMFFVIILLIIAFATILKVEKYSIKALLPKVIIAAVLINFSKMICGLLIDMGQVVMLTFVNGYKASAGANLINGLKLDSWMSIDPSGVPEGGTLDMWDIVLALALATILLFVTMIVSLMILVTLVARIVTLWILVVLSPFAFVGSLLPFTAGMAKQWWSTFGKWVAMGPILAFFLWLSLLMMQTGFEEPGTPNGIEDIGKSAQSKSPTGDTLGPNTVSKGGKIDNLAQFAVAAAMLYGSIMATQKMGGSVGGFVAGKAGRALKGAISKRTYVSAGRTVGRTVGGAGKLIGKTETGAAVGRALSRGAKVAGAGAWSMAKTPFRVLRGSVEGARKMSQRMHEVKAGGGGILKATAAGGLAGMGALLGGSKFMSDVRRADNKAMAANIEVRKKKVNEMVSGLKAKGKPEQSANQIGNTALNLEDRVAHAAYALEKGEVKTDQQKEALRALQKALDGSKIASRRAFGGILGEQTKKKFANFKYDFSTPKGQEDVLKAAGKGEVNLLDQDSSFYEDGENIKLLRQYYKDDADKGLKKVYEKGGLHRSSLMKGMSAVTNSAGMTLSPETEAIKNKPETQRTSQEEATLWRDGTKADWQNVTAKMTGKPQEVYTDPKAYAEFMGKRPASELKKQTMGDINRMATLSAGPGGDVEGQKQKILEELSKTVDHGKIKNIMDENKPLAVELVKGKLNVANKSTGAEQEAAQKDISTIAGISDIMDLLDKADKEAIKTAVGNWSPKAAPEPEQIDLNSFSSNVQNIINQYKSAGVKKVGQQLEAELSGAESRLAKAMIGERQKIQNEVDELKRAMNEVKTQKL
ncbi:MAG TPA: hypothetical protein VMX18_02490 [Candidatus Bipolaricaulota bacterium]|nr:hypothetical protein [Candidatus Bipolaricaulota bacterium]